MLLLLVCMVFIWRLKAVPQPPLNMYNIHDSDGGYCLSHYVLDDFALVYNDYFVDSLAHQTISYCLRSPVVNISRIDLGEENTVGPRFTMMQLKEQNITSSMLLAWSSTIDYAEEYQIFLNSNPTVSPDTEPVFHNCTSSWFGPYCRFTFGYRKDQSFHDIVRFIFDSRTRVSKEAHISCYVHLHCQTQLTCLDWREICDGKNDCVDGLDEHQCWELEANECAANEYRCHNGQCIPVEFFRDGSLNPDCLDRTDESLQRDDFSVCRKDPGFRCEEHLCHPGGADFPCGDGQCTNGLYPCFNGRSITLPGDFCSNATACWLQLSNQVDSKWCKKFCPTPDCFKDRCQALYEFRSISLVFGHIRLIFSNQSFLPDQLRLPEYVCYDEKRCAYFPPTERFANGWTCRSLHDTGLENIETYYYFEQLLQQIKERFRMCSIFPLETDYCNHSIMYSCENSTKCISRNRLLDGMRDCPLDDDETFNNSCSLPDRDHRFKCSNDPNEQCFASLIIRDRKKNCPSGEDELSEKLQWQTKHIYFPTICDGKTDLLPVWIDERNETDETECQHWPCDNAYTRCDQFWLCENGADEVNCPPSTCPARQHSCINPNNSSQISCLPLNQSGDGFDHCLGGTDERTKYLNYVGRDQVAYYFHCWNDTKSIEVSKLCNGQSDCRFNDDESFCQSVGTTVYPLCTRPKAPLTDTEKYLCSLDNKILLSRMLYFTVGNIPAYPLESKIDYTIPSTYLDESIAPRSTETDTLTPNISIDKWWCHRGIPIHLRLKKNSFELKCLCPPNYYGERCEYQSQRVSLTLDVRCTSEWRDVFIFLIHLIDQERTIHSHDHIEYVSIRDCRMKFNVYLLYSDRPKEASKNYSVHIDAFHQMTLSYRASWGFPLRFSFLPVHRLSILLKVPFANVEPSGQCQPPCVHGRCFSYVNDPTWSFCQCASGWAGVQCDVRYSCDCASGSLCLSHSRCICPSNRFGPRCHLFQTSCHSQSCLNGGQCVPTDRRLANRRINSSMCICLTGYLGDRCQDREQRTEIEVTFQSTMTIPSSLLVHLITTQPNNLPNRTSLMKKIPFDQYKLTFSTSVPFHLAFAQISNQYFLIILREQLIVSARISTRIIPSHRCQSITELFNETLAKAHLLKAIKYYHRLCIERIGLACFYDKVHLCLCTGDLQANCLEFDHQMTYDCQGSNFCENQGQCFQDDPRCPTSAFCACRQCYFGSRCQFSTKGSTLSLDIILGYHIHPKTGITQQPLIVKGTILLVVVVFIIGMVNSFLAFQTFQGQETRRVGCGLYLFVSSIVSMMIVILFTLKCALLIAAQIGSIRNRPFLLIQCLSMDYLIRLGLSTVDWLSACVAIERSVNVLQGIKFDKSNSKKVANWMIVVIVLCTGSSYICDPLSRYLVDDEDDQRLWCVTRYNSSSIQLFDWLMNIFHFALPFTINSLSAAIIIITAARTRSNSQKARSYQEHLRQQLKHHQHLLISPSILVALAFPRLIFSFLSGCMESARDSWFYLLGFFVSFIPPMMTFIVFVLPSDMYKEEFHASIKRFWRN